MNADFILGQLRLALTAFIAYAGGRGWFTPADSTLALAMLTSLGPIAAPWLLSIITNWNKKHVPQDSVAIKPDPDKPMYRDTDGGIVTTGKIVGTLLFAFLIFAPTPSTAGPIADKIAADIAAKTAEIRATVVVDLTAARDDAKDNSDPSEICWQVLLNHAEKMPPKIMGVAHGIQRLRTLRRGLPALLDACAVVKDGARQALIMIFGASVVTAAAF